MLCCASTSEGVLREVLKAVRVCHANYSRFNFDKFKSTHTYKSEEKHARLNPEAGKLDFTLAQSVDWLKHFISSENQVQPEFPTWLDCSLELISAPAVLPEGSHLTPSERKSSAFFAGWHFPIVVPCHRVLNSFHVFHVLFALTHLPVWCLGINHALEGHYAQGLPAQGPASKNVFQGGGAVIICMKQRSSHTW